MKRMILAIGLAVAFSVQVFADVTIKSTGTGKGMGMSAKMNTVTYLKGMKMRTDTVKGDTTDSVIFDLENQKMYSFNSKKKEADVWDMATISEEMSKVVEVKEIKSSIKPNGQTKQFGARTANGYDIEVSVPFVMGGEGGPELTMMMTGQTWVVKGAPGTADYAAFYKAAAEKGWIFSHPSAAKAQPGQARAMAEMYREIAALGGIPYEMNVDMQIRMGDVAVNPVALLSGLLGRRGGSTMTTIVESIETGALSDDLFTPPAGIQLVPKN
jgi:hypothetical protein